MTLEQLIREAALRGDLSGLTLWKQPDGTYLGSTTADRVGWRCEVDADPVEALQRALSAPAEPPPASGSIFD